MVKLPRIFYHHDKILHALFYFFATITIALMYPKKWVMVSICLTLFGFAIEFAQEFSNKISKILIGKVIHGKFDITDIKYNLIGLLSGILVFHIIKHTFKYFKNE
jgi:glycopeptide antibiotics resistance protein